MAADEGGLARRLWVKFREQYSVLVLYSPFFVGLASATLDFQTTFRHFISQHLHFLKAFARAYELAEECADDDDDKNGIRVLRKRVTCRLQKHDAFFRAWGFELLPDEGISKDIATIKYTDFVLSTASGKIEGERSVPGKIATPFEKTKVAAYTLAALAPCMRLCSFISKEIQAILEPEDYNTHIYKSWMENYSSHSFEATALQNEDMLDKLSISLTGEELEIIEKLYHQAMKLQLDFIIGQPISDQQSVVPLCRMHDFTECRLTILCDFDLACTAVDSAAILAEIAIITASKADLGESETILARISSADLRSTWHVLSTQYTEEFEQCVESIGTSKRVQEFNYEGLCNSLEQLAEFERKANQRVVQSGVLKGLNVEDIKRAGKSLILQNGCRSFFQKVVKSENLKTDVHVLSYCWCNDLIVSAFSSGELNVLNVHANELVYQESVTTGEIVKKMESPMEKLQAFNEILLDLRIEGKDLTVYIGGSVGDLLCLLEADIGIVIGSSSCLRRLGDHFGVSFVPLFAGLVKRQRELADQDSFCNWKPLSGVLYTVSCWAEIEAFVLGT